MMILIFIEGFLSFFHNKLIMYTWKEKLILSEYNPLPAGRLYWCQNEDYKYVGLQCYLLQLVLILMKYIHLVDNMRMNAVDKIWKLRLFMDLQVKFINNYISWENMNFNESIIDYYELHGCKQFMRVKFIRYEYKNWSGIWV